MKITTKKTEKLATSVNKLEMDKRIFDRLAKKYSLSHIAEISAEFISVFKDALIKKETIKIPGMFSTKIKQVKTRQFVSINTPRNGVGKLVKSQSLPHLRAVIKLSKEIQKMLNGQETKKTPVKKTTTKTATKTTDKKTTTTAKKK